MRLSGFRNRWPCEALDHVEQREEDDAEDEHRLRVALPVLLAARRRRAGGSRARASRAAAARPCRRAPCRARAGSRARSGRPRRRGSGRCPGRSRPAPAPAEPHLRRSATAVKPTVTVLTAEERVHEVREHEQRDDEPDDVGGRHQTRPSTQMSRNAKAKQAAAIASAARSYISAAPARRGRVRARARHRRRRRAVVERAAAVGRGARSRRAACPARVDGPLERRRAASASADDVAASYGPQPDAVQRRRAGQPQRPVQLARRHRSQRAGELKRFRAERQLPSAPARPIEPGVAKCRRAAYGVRCQTGSLRAVSTPSDGRPGRGSTQPQELRRPP